MLDPDKIQLLPGQLCAHLVEENGIVICDYTKATQGRRDNFSIIRQHCPQNILPYTNNTCHLKTADLPLGAAQSMKNRIAQQFSRLPEENK